MKTDRICKICNGKQQDGVPFPKYGKVCSKCKNEETKQYLRENKERVAARKAEYHRLHRDDINAYCRQYYQDNKERIAKRHARYHQEHKEHINAQDREEYAEKVKDKPPRPCIDCGAPMPKRAVKYCEQCRAKHDNESVRKAMKRYRLKE